MIDIIGFFSVQLAILVGYKFYKKYDPEGYPAYRIYLMVMEVIAVAFLIFRLTAQ